MRKHLLQIDVSKSKYEIEEDLIKIPLRNEESIQVNFSNCVKLSKYIRDKYTYPDALKLIQQDIKKIKQKFHIADESIKLFFQLIQEEKVNITTEHYKAFYTLSEYFCISKLMDELDNISREELFNNLDFTIQILIDYKSIKNSIETKLTNKVEKFISERINDCIKNSKFKELPIQTINKVLDQSKDIVDQNLLVDFILESAECRSNLLKYLDIHKMSNKKVGELIKFIEKQDENSRNIYMKNIPFDLSSIKNEYDLQRYNSNQRK